ncbi:T9SS type A sorting domain-containing protein [Crocinitomix catalasitica]|nr:T9SS type A sorting domain-containing protein [Crocinitomix catalasitica]
MKTVMLILSLFIVKSVTAQGVWAPPGATWHYSYINLAVQGYVKITYIGDSLFNGKDCKMLEKEYYLYYYSSETVSDWVFDTAFTYFSNDSVYHYTDGQFYLLYDFAATTTDIWNVEEGYECIDSLAQVVVDSTGTTTINSLSLDWSSVSLNGLSSTGFYGKVLERIGCHDFYMFPEKMCIADGQEGGSFRCYYDDVFGLYEKPGEPACDFIIGYKDFKVKGIEVSIYPNPTEDFVLININNFDGSLFEINLVNSLGQAVHTLQTTSASFQIDLSQYPAGTYLLNIRSEGYGGVTKRIVKRAGSK